MSQHRLQRARAPLGQGLGGAALGALLLGGLVLVAAPAVQARIYKWVDDEGVVHYTQTPPPDRKAQPLRPRIAPVTPEQARERLEALRKRSQSERKNRELIEGEAKREQARERQMAENCRIARRNLEVLENSARVQAKDAAGNPFYLTEEARQAKMAQTRSQIEEFCK